MLGVTINDTTLFNDALTHGSNNAKSSGRATDYQRLEFLGDRILGLIIAETLYHRYPKAQEGDLSARLNLLVSRASCADVARELGIAPHIRLGKQARDDGARDSENILGDVIESLIGAVFLDTGLDEARAMILRLWGERIDAVASDARHPKSILLEWAAANKRKPPAYQLLSRDGPDHAPLFTVQVSIAHAGEATGSGPSKQDAEKNAAARLISQLEIQS